MFGLATIDVLIGLVTVYLVFALACTAIVEALSSMLDVRGKKLAAALGELFSGKLAQDKSFVAAFYDHPLVQALSQGQKGRPSYIPTEVVGQVVASLLLKDDPAASLEQAIDALPDITIPGHDTPGAVKASRIKELFKTFMSQGQRDMQSFRTAVETHFDAVMDRASGWVKRRQQKVALFVSAALVLGANVDTISMANAIYTSPELRAGLVAQAEQMVNKVSANTPSSGQPRIPPAIQAALPISVPAEDPLATEKQQLKAAIEAYTDATATLETAGLQFGWKRIPANEEWPLKIVGLLISIFAVALGAPFWFDVLKRFMKVRHSGISPNEKKGKDKS
jgi:hypothetical protein